MLSLGFRQDKQRASDEGLRKAIAALVRVLARHSTEVSMMRRRLAVLERDVQVLKEEQSNPTPRRGK